MITGGGGRMIPYQRVNIWYVSIKFKFITNVTKSESRIGHSNVCIYLLLYTGIDR